MSSATTTTTKTNSKKTNALEQKGKQTDPDLNQASTQQEPALNQATAQPQTQTTAQTQTTQTTQSLVPVAPQQPDYCEFWKVNWDHLRAEKASPPKNGYRVGKFSYASVKDGNLVTQTPWLRTTSGWVVNHNALFGPSYLMSLSMYPTDSKENGARNVELTTEFQPFIERVNDVVLEIVKENWEEWVGTDVPSDAVLREYQTSVIHPERDGYPASYKFNFKDMVHQEEYDGAVFEQTFNIKLGKPGRSAKESKISRIRKNARVRYEILLKSFYFSFTEDPDTRDQRIRFGANWMVQKVLFYNVLSTITDPEALKSNTFGDIETNETYAPGPVPKVKIAPKRYSDIDVDLIDNTGAVSNAKAQPENNKRTKVI